MRLDPAHGAVYAVGDVHGCLDQLLRLEDLIRRDGEALPGTKLLVMLGDYVDRGPRSAGVIDHLLTALPAGFQRVCLCGNHEEMMLRFLDDPARNGAWLDAGGTMTLASYGLDIRHLLKTMGNRMDRVRQVLRETVPPEHIAFLRDLPVLAWRGRIVFVHAGIRPGVALDAQTDRDLLWMREPFLSSGPGLPMTVVHGHTPVRRPYLGDNRVGIDTGVAATGVLTALRVAFDRGRFLDSEGRYGASIVVDDNRTRTVP